MEAEISRGRLACMEAAKGKLDSVIARLRTVISSSHYSNLLHPLTKGMRERGTRNDEGMKSKMTALLLVCPDVLEDCDRAKR